MAKDQDDIMDDETPQERRRREKAQQEEAEAAAAADFLGAVSLGGESWGCTCETPRVSRLKTGTSLALAL
jgi:hypothetical protein